MYSFDTTDVLIYSCENDDFDKHGNISNIFEKIPHVTCAFESFLTYKTHFHIPSENKNDL